MLNLPSGWRAQNQASLKAGQTKDPGDSVKSLHRTFIFKNFKQAFAFMTEVALYSEQHNHHPEWFNVYNRVEITLTTHDTSCVTQKDIALAKYCDQVAKRYAS